MPKREFLQLAHKFDMHGGTHIGGWMVSEKLDGIRAFWDGGISRGLPASEVPYANVTKDYRYKEPPLATGLWSRYGKVIHAPTEWLDQLPHTPLDGELWVGRGEGSRQRLIRIVKRLDPDIPGWMNDVRFMVIEPVNLFHILHDGKIDNLHFKKVLRCCPEWADSRIRNMAFKEPSLSCRFASAYKVGCILLGELNSAIARMVTQETLPSADPAARERVRERFIEVVSCGGEGVIVRSPESIYAPERSHRVLKKKSIQESEGTIIGFVSGAETDLGSKLLGKIGSLMIRMDDSTNVFQLSGLTHEERELNDEAQAWALDHPQMELPSSLIDPAKHFRIGERVQYKFRTLTKDGYPEEARYLRKRDSID